MPKRSAPANLDLASGASDLGERLRAERVRRNIGLRELSRRVDVSASMVSQIELGKARPSVSTLYAITAALGVSLDELFANEPPEQQVQDTPSRAGLSLERARDHTVLQLASGVSWKLLLAEPGQLDFLDVTYDVGSESASADAQQRHGGTEYGIVIEGQLGVTVGVETVALGPGDCIAFESTTPHRLFNLSDQPTRAIWVVIGRSGDRRINGKLAARSAPRAARGDDSSIGA